MTRRSLKPLALLATSLALVAGAATFLACATPPKAGAAAGKAPAATAKADTAAGKASAGAAKGDAVAGKKIFSVKCIACHKPDGTGGIKLTGNPTPNWKDPKTWADPKAAAAQMKSPRARGRPVIGHPLPDPGIYYPCT